MWEKYKEYLIGGGNPENFSSLDWSLYKSMMRAMPMVIIKEIIEDIKKERPEIITYEEFVASFREDKINIILKDNK